MSIDYDQVSNMRIERATQIVGQMVRVALTGDGLDVLGGEASQKLLMGLQELTLAEMVEANRLVARANTGMKPPCSIQVICDERLIAAIYVSLHYGIAAEPILSLYDKLVVVARREKCEQNG